MGRGYNFKYKIVLSLQTLKKNLNNKLFNSTSILPIAWPELMFYMVINRISWGADFFIIIIIIKSLASSYIIVYINNNIL